MFNNPHVRFIYSLFFKVSLEVVDNWEAIHEWVKLSNCVGVHVLTIMAIIVILYII